MALPAWASRAVVAREHHEGRDDAWVWLANHVARARWTAQVHGRFGLGAVGPELAAALAGERATAGVINATLESG
jgi:hypothetical protein